MCSKEKRSHNHLCFFANVVEIGLRVTLFLYFQGTLLLRTLDATLSQCQKNILNRMPLQVLRERSSSLKLHVNLPQVCRLDLGPAMSRGGKRGGGKVKLKKHIHLWFRRGYMTRAPLSCEC